ncbi:hypothetical protein FHS95_001608 [Sphingomonas naasensis]|uniref:Uncharacterized protein n=1 Tax=Sphingomonas naasensis TaxID=1344951 RepID=A0A4S1W5L5_9SPHN|nr:hypothetical protein [Sphingomonas naasensis]NIJ19939.1 hypothetical protein [Sphingomonas naasensis]TGX37898.1 hypothetical protein E5A74_19170 [Sphingomonas naasensis]
MLVLAMMLDLAPLDRLVGHCWRGELKPGEFDTHCFDRNGTGVRDHHEVVVAGRTVYWGESDFSWDATAGRIAFAYRNAGGPVTSGLATVSPEGIDFGHVQWRWDGDTAYVMLREGARVRFVRTD